ncbi:hypothetical protein LZ198_08045 [Myxococcus sp. K15C18031901]|uniref:hypothetical protein n=1 Tax=Myxococcus dinghuensis TaxID=2906761 RepID=UPI0020A74287|nr:hypothetical protein [Myxococcus dinghuensis]MCP3098825.1 hypothetical protein [Myxococcus dinghuensis]
MSMFYCSWSCLFTPLLLLLSLVTIGLGTRGKPRRLVTALVALGMAICLTVGAWWEMRRLRYPYVDPRPGPPVGDLVGDWLSPTLGTVSLLGDGTYLRGAERGTWTYVDGRLHLGKERWCVHRIDGVLRVGNPRSCLPVPDEPPIDGDDAYYWPEPIPFSPEALDRFFSRVTTPSRDAQGRPRPPEAP